MADLAPPLTLVVAGVLGPVFHAQGVSAGRPCSVIQMGGCNLSCSWCDSAFTWDNSRFDLTRQLANWPVEEIVAQALAPRPAMVVISGGEPLLQQNSPAWPVLLEALGGNEIGIETNGTLIPSEATMRRVSWVTVSPKLAHSGDPAWARINGQALVRWGQLAHQYYVDFSFVVRDVSDVATISTLVSIHGLPARRVWVIPEGTTAVTSLNRLRDVADAALTAGFNLSPRVSALIANTPGVTAATSVPLTDGIGISQAAIDQSSVPVGDATEQQEGRAERARSIAPRGARFPRNNR